MKIKIISQSNDPDERLHWYNWHVGKEFEANKETAGPRPNRNYFYVPSEFGYVEAKYVEVVDENRN